MTVESDGAINHILCSDNYNYPNGTPRSIFWQLPLLNIVSDKG